MCGIIGVTGTGPAVPRLIDSLKRLEYRGYDSAGVAALVDGKIERRRAKGKIRELEAVLAAEPLNATWSASATPAGPPTARRPPPTPTRTRRAGSRWCTTASSRTSPNCAKAELTAEGHAFESQTDTEVIAHLLDAN
jgi:glucosamine--fructose-6-phosphate aminotransferase (isomerizing)